MMLVQHGLADRLHHIIGMNSGIDANDRRDANHWSDVNDRRNVDRRRDIRAGHRRRRDHEQCGSDDFLHGFFCSSPVNGSRWLLARPAAVARCVGFDNVGVVKAADGQRLSAV
jgi:hypothetical protein